MHAKLDGVTARNFWSDPSAWADNHVPKSSHGLDVLVETYSTADVGTAADPFIANDVVGATEYALIYSETYLLRISVTSTK